MFPKNLVLFTIPFLLVTVTIYSQELTIPESEENDLKVEALGNFIQNQIHEGNSDGYMSKFDTSHILNNIKFPMSNTEIPENYKKGFLIGVANGINEFPKKIIEQVQNDTFYDFVNYRYDTDTQSYYMLFRLFGTDFGINYHEYSVIKNNDDFMFNDIFVYLSGENISNTLTRVLMLSSDLFKSDTTNKYNKLSKVFIDKKAGNNQNAHDILANLTEDKDMSKEKFLHILRIQMAQQLSDQDYMDAIENLKANFENDPTIYLTLIDYYLIKEDYSTAFDLVDNLQVETSDDFLNYIKGNIEFLKGNYADAQLYYEYMIENYEGFYIPYFSNVSALALQKKYDETVLLLDKITEVMEYPKSELIDFIEETEEGDDTYELEGLVNSSAYKKWKKKI